MSELPPQDADAGVGRYALIVLAVLFFGGLLACIWTLSGEDR